MSSEPIVELTSVRKDYPLGKVTVPAVQGIDLRIETREFACLSGPSGCGKTTLLNLIGCVDLPTSGTVKVAGQEVTTLGDRRLTRLRLHTIGFIFQSFNLVDVLTAFQNVEFPLLLKGGAGRRERQQRVAELLEKVGLKDQMRHRPGELSGGQRQRVAIARALITHPRLVLADEPTANLDSVTGEAIIGLMRQLNEQEGTTFLFSTHDPRVTEKANRIIRLRDGKIAD